MTQEERNLLFIELSGRLHYGVKVQTSLFNNPTSIKGIAEDECWIYCDEDNYEWIDIEKVKPYLRPLSSMTEEEFMGLTTTTELQYDQLELVEWDNNCKTLEFYLSEVPHYCVIKVFDWLNVHHFDFRGLIERGLALEAPAKMYKN